MDIFKWLIRNSATGHQYYILALFSVLPFPVWLGNKSTRPLLKLTISYRNIWWGLEGDWIVWRSYQTIFNSGVECSVYTSRYSNISLCDGSFYDGSFLRPLSSRTEHSRLVVHRCINSSDLSVHSLLLVLFRCACVSSWSILDLLRWLWFFFTRDVHQKERKEEEIKTVDVAFFRCLLINGPGLFQQNKE